MSTQPVLLVANRGEIVHRVFRTARAMGYRCAAVYSDADRDAPFVFDADVAVRLGPAPSSESYLRRDRVLEAAREVGAELIHPGYGFLAEDASFARDCEDLGFTFVGPPARVLEATGEKARAKQMAAEAGVPVLEGHTGDDRELADAAARIGYPALVKPAAGGGGKGMVVVREPGELPDALASARRVAEAAFGDSRLLLERYLTEPRHIEVQIVADAHGNVVHLYERDCSLQRRHQKILEEAPAPNLDEELRRRLHESAVAFARHVGYVGAGTCEFLVSADGAMAFLEMNARLQVEHPVTEEVTGLDIVELQLRVARGEELPLSQDDVSVGGHAIEVRVYAEDPAEGFLPQAGRVFHLRWPEGARVDAGIVEGGNVTTHYDPMLGKLVVWGEDRVAALWELHRRLGKAELLGPRTNLAFLRAVSQDAVVLDGKVTTTWLEEAYRRWRPKPGPLELDFAVVVAAAAEADRVIARDGRDPWEALGPWRIAGERVTRIVLRPEGEERVVEVCGSGPYRVGKLAARRLEDCHGWTLTEGAVRLAAARDEGRWLVWFGSQIEIDVGIAPRTLEATGLAHLGAPMPGQVIAVHVAVGDEVAEGQELVVVEAMKMEHAVRAPAPGVVTAVLCAPGDQVDREQPLVDVEPV